MRTAPDIERDRARLRSLYNERNRDEVLKWAEDNNAHRYVHDGLAAGLDFERIREGWQHNITIGDVLGLRAIGDEARLRHMQYMVELAWEAALHVRHQPDCGWTLEPVESRHRGKLEGRERELCTCGLANLMRVLEPMVGKSPGV